MKYNRLASFQNTPSKLSKYRLALSVLYELGVDQLLADMGTPLDVPDDHPNALLLNALRNQRLVGYRECIENLFNLDSTAIPAETTPTPDYGAVDKMIREGKITQADAEAFLKEI